MSAGLALLVGLVLAAPVARAEDAPRVEAELQADTTYLGESVAYVVRVLNLESPPEPELSGFDGFQVERQPPTSLNSSSISIVNGRMTRFDQHGKQWVYKLTPKAAGDVAIPAPSVTVDGKRISGPALTLRVLAPERSDLVEFSATVDRHGKYPMQPFTFVLKVFVRKLPAPYDDHDPLEPTDPPRLRVPWADTPDGLLTDRLQDWLTPLLARNDERRGSGPVGFRINDVPLRDAGPFTLFAGPRDAVFDLGGRSATDADVAAIDALRGRASQWYVYELKRRFTPLRSGSYRFEASCLQGELVAAIEARRPVGRRVFACGGALEVTVADAPVEGRPAGFSGAFGRGFRANAEIAPRRARVGDPMTYTMTVSGTGNLDHIAPPVLAELPEVAARFAVEAPSVESKDGSRVFTWSVRPKSREASEFPPVKFSWFDPDQEKFGEVVTRTLPIVVDAIEDLAPGAIVKGGEARPAERDVARASGYFGNDTDPRGLRDDRPNVRLLLATPPALLALYFLIAVLAARRARLSSDPARVRRRGAARRARERLGRLRAIPGDSASARAEAAHGVVAGLVADAAAISEAGLAARDVATGLSALGASAGSIARAVALLDRCDQLRFGVPDAGADLVAETEAVVGALIDELRRQGRIG